MSAGDDDPLVQGVHDLAAFLGGNEERSDDGRDDGNGAEHQGKQHRALTHVDHDQAAEQHRGDQRDRVGFEQVGGHARAVADVVADVVGNDRRIARIILRNARLDLADQIGTDIGALGENAAAQVEQKSKSTSRRTPGRRARATPTPHRRARAACPGSSRPRRAIPSRPPAFR